MSKPIIQQQVDDLEIAVGVVQANYLPKSGGDITGDFTWKGNHLCTYPDYAKAISKNRSTEYTAEMDGYLYMHCNDFQVSPSHFTVNGTVFTVNTSGGNGSSGSSAMVPLAKGDVYRVDFARDDNSNQILFIPARGAE